MSCAEDDTLEVTKELWRKNRNNPGVCFMINKNMYFKSGANELNSSVVKNNNRQKIFLLKMKKAGFA